MNLDQYKVNWPPAQVGDWAIEKFTVTPEESRVDALRATLSESGLKTRFTPPGDYTRLTYRGNTIMSDTPNELIDLLPFFQKAKGRVLIAGLGLGVALRGALLKTEVNAVNVVELSSEVMDLVTPHFVHDPRVTIHLGSAFSWNPPAGVLYDTIWFDIWDTINADNLLQMELLKKLFAIYLTLGGWQGCWSEKESRILQKIGY